MLWAVGVAAAPITLTLHTAHKTLLSIQSAADALAALHSSLEREEIIHIKGGNAATSNTITSFSFTSSTFRYSKVSLMRHIS